MKKLIIFAALVFFVLGSVFLSGTAQAGKKLKAGFIYVGPVGDYGWSHAHEMGRRYAMKNLPWLDSVYVESVSEADCARIIDRLIQGEPVYTFSHYSPMEKFGPDSAVSGQLVDWGIMYVKILKDIHDGKWANEDLWWRVKEGAAHLGASPDHKINPKFVGKLKSIMINTPDLGKISAYDLVMKRLGQMKQGPELFDPFVGPIKDNKGNLRLKKGERATKAQLLSINYYVDTLLSGCLPVKIL